MHHMTKQRSVSFSTGSMSCTDYAHALDIAAYASSLGARICLHTQALAHELVRTVPYRNAWYDLHAQVAN